MRVLLVSPHNDVHANVVAAHIGSRAEISYFDLQRAVERPLHIRPGEFVASDGEVVARSGDTVWWRRTGFVPAHPSTGNAENRLRSEEVRAQMVGGLLALDVRWVDHPGSIELAEHTLLQLSVATQVGAATPPTLVTNVPEVARQFTTKRLVAKSISAGVGIAPYADFADDEIIEALPHAPTLIQEHVEGAADLRVVVVGQQAFIWRREKNEGEPFDWRRPDPSGRGFRRVESPEVARLSVAITHQLGLSFSAQDWVETAREAVFLESNPVGQWLFLEGAEDLIGGALADHLLNDQVAP